MTTTHLQEPTDKHARAQLVEQLAREIAHHQDLYYNKTPAISDGEFDALWDKLRSLEPDHPRLRVIGADEGFFPKTAHIMPMGSLEKAADEEAFYAWAAEQGSECYVVQHKLDGASLELQYVDGVLRAAVTRGDGAVGDNIFVNARNMQGVIKQLPLSLNCALRGEVIMTHEVHKKYFSDKANCRNAANGLMKKKDGVGVKHLQVLCYDLWFEQAQEQRAAFEFLRENGGAAHNSAQSRVERVRNFDEVRGFSEDEKLQFLRACGFATAPHAICKDAAAVCEYRNAVMKTREKLGYDIDGLVVKAPYAQKDDMLLARPKRHIAFKFPLEHAVTVLREIIWSESGHLYTPVALLEPVRIAGTVVKRANLVHPQHIEELQIRLGSQVMVAKRGEIIPKVERLVHTPEDAKQIVLPSHCSTCGTAVVNEGTRLYCPNFSCRRRLLFRVERWIAVHEIDYWGTSLLYRLVLEEKLVNTMGDLYRLSEDTLASLDRIAAPLAKKLHTSLHKNTSVSFERFLASIGIENVAALTGRKLVAAGIDNWDALLSAEEGALSDIDGIGPTIAQAIVHAVHNLRVELEDLLHFVRIAENSQKNAGALVGMSFCFTGTLTHNGRTIARKEAEGMVSRAGGSVKTSVTKDLTYLVTDDVNARSTKSKKAQEYGTSLISCEAFLQLLEGKKG